MLSHCYSCMCTSVHASVHVLTFLGFYLTFSFNSNHQLLAGKTLNEKIHILKIPKNTRPVFLSANVSWDRLQFLQRVNGE